MKSVLRVMFLSVVSTVSASVAFAASTSSSPSGRFDSRWELMAEAHQRVHQLLSRAESKLSSDDMLDSLEAAMAKLKGECNLLPVTRERASCLDDLGRLTTMAKTAAHPDDPNRNPVFPTNIPDFVSPEMKKVMREWTPNWLTETPLVYPEPDDYEAWSSLHDELIDPMMKAGEALLKTVGATTEERKIGGVRTVWIHPRKNKHPKKVLMHLHGGAFYGNTPETTFDRTVPLADRLGMTVVSVDYKLMPAPNWDILDQRDQIIDVFDALTGEGGEYAPGDVGIYGCSAGGGLVAMSVNALSHRGGPLPGAAVAQSPQTDFSFDSDSYWTLRYDDPRTLVDHLIESVWPMLGITEEKARDPRYSTVLDNFEGRDFPPTMVQVGTKEVQMSDGIRLYDVLRRAGHVAQLDAHDAMQHCFHGHWGTPEAKVAVDRVAEWFEKHLY